MAAESDSVREGLTSAHDDERNRLLRALPLAEYDRLLPEFRPVRRSLKDVLIDPNTEIAHVMMLGVRRADVSVAMGVFQRASIVAYVGGRVTVLNRDGLETGACDCYRITREAPRGSSASKHRRVNSRLSRSLQPGDSFHGGHGRERPEPVA